MTTRTTVTDVLTALPLEGYDFDAVYDLFERAGYEVIAERGDRITIDITDIVNPLIGIAAAAIELCASRSRTTRGEVIFDLRQMLTDTTPDSASTGS